MDFENIYKEYYPDVFRYCYSFTQNEAVAEEIAQETFFKALGAISKYDGTKDIRAWLFTIAKNTFISQYRKSQKEFPMDADFRETADGRKDFVECLMDEESAIQIHQFLHGLKEPYKEVFNLRVFGELNFEKIGMIFGKSDSWARVTFYRAKSMVVDYMEEIKDGK